MTIICRWSWKLPAHSDVEIFEILPRDRNLKLIFTQKWASVDMNCISGFKPLLNPLPRQLQPWSTFGPQAPHADFHCPSCALAGPWSHVVPPASDSWCRPCYNVQRHADHFVPARAALIRWRRRGLVPASCQWKWAKDISTTFIWFVNYPSLAGLFDGKPCH